jgi:hypothetical protein
VFVSPIKEPCFFAPEVAEITPRDRLVLDWDDYRQLFSGVRQEQAIGEASVAYLASPNAAAAIRARLPDARIVMMLRNPVDRLFSRYLAARDSGDRTSFNRWLDQRLAEGQGRGSIWPGRYAVHLQRYLANFPAEQIRVFVYDDYVRSPRELLRELFEFLGVDPGFLVDDTRHHNVTMTRRWPVVHRWLRPVRHLVPSRIAELGRRWLLMPRLAKPTAAERARALDVYREDIRTLETLIQRDLSEWLRS